MTLYQDVVGTPWLEFNGQTEGDPLRMHVAANEMGSRSCLSVRSSKLWVILQMRWAAGC
jgi:hypothetical protein